MSCNGRFAAAKLPNVSAGGSTFSDRRSLVSGHFQLHHGKICTKILGISSHYITWVCLHYQIQSIKLFWSFFINFTFNPELFLKTFSPKTQVDFASFWLSYPMAPNCGPFFPPLLVEAVWYQFLFCASDILSIMPNCHQVKTQTFLQILALRIYWTCNVLLLQLSTWRSWQIALWAHAPEALELKRMSFRPVCPWIHFVADLVQVN